MDRGVTKCDIAHVRDRMRPADAGLRPDKPCGGQGGDSRIPDVSTSAGSGSYFSAEEAAQVLRVSPRTLANWRARGEGPTYKKIGGRVAYPRQAVLDFGAEIGAGRRSKPDVTITLRPYHRDKTRIQVDIMIAHPATDEPIRTRPVAPKGMDETAARAWAEKKVQEINRKLFREASKAELEQHKQAVATNTKTSNKKSKQKAAPRSESCPTLAELWDRYYTEILSDREQTRRTTEVCYEKVWRSIEGLVGKIRCDAWTKADSKRLAAQFADASPRHANRVNTVVSNLFKIAIEDEHIDDPPRFIRRKVKKTLKPAAHNRDDLELLLAAARELDIETGESMEVILLLGVDAGLRPGEVAGLRWSDVDWNANHILIQNQRPMPMPEDEEYPVKYDEVGRLTMTTRLRKAIERRHARGDAKRYVCVSASGDALYTYTVSDRVYRIHERAGLPLKKRGHFLRLCAASRVAHHPRAGVADAQGLLRHKNMTTTEIYLQELRGTDTSRRAAAILNLVEEEETGTTLAPAGTEPQLSRPMPN